MEKELKPFSEEKAEEIAVDNPEDLAVEKIKEKIELLHLKQGDPVEIIFKSNGHIKKDLGYFDQIYDGKFCFQTGDDVGRLTDLRLECIYIIDIKRWLEIP